ncbi:proline dehydrogenase family protein [Candidatus Marsarchaeota archaeon]|nr:proline dehydrogenase family protein [Candidatus Marsarchaeota archaeon]
MSFVNKAGMIFARKWIGGITISDVLAVCKNLNNHGEHVIINYLGEDYTDELKTKSSTGKYVCLIREMKKLKINGDIALKPTQLGLRINYGMFLSNYEKIVNYADRHRIRVWLDMEDYMLVDDTIRAYLHELKLHKNVGICIQSKLKRSTDDIRRITGKGGMIRLVKGAYPARSGITYLNKWDIDTSYIHCMKYLFKHSNRFMIATHDDSMIDLARDLEIDYNKSVMFAMLKGIRGKLALQLVSDKENVYIYVPFGEDWVEYSARRLKELEHSLLILRSIISG